MTARPQLMLNRKSYQVSKPEMEFHMINIINAALPMRTQTEKTTFSCKDDYTLKKYTWGWTYSGLQYLFYLCSVSLGDALTTAAVWPFFLKRHNIRKNHVLCQADAPTKNGSIFKIVLCLNLKTLKS